MTAPTAHGDVRVPLGPFVLHRRIGRGAMGEVWRGVHREQDVPVAVKLITAEHARDQRVLDAFHNEVRSVASLHHPGIVMVLDYGAVPYETVLHSDGAVTEGSPFLAMEYASGGTLPRPRSPMPWNRLRAMLLELLDALGHAHARGVIHRDIKPGNILIATLGDGRAGLKLSDFGIARALGNAAEGDAVVSGTPHYMAPEQILDHRRDQGPWTDLYALGCLAYQLATGRRVFEGVRGTDLLRSHVHAPPPPIRADHLPRGFEDWIARMLAKQPTERFRLSADAAWGLLQLDEPDDDALDRTVVAAALDIEQNTTDPLSDRIIADLASPLPTATFEDEQAGDTVQVSPEQLAALHQPDPHRPFVEVATLDEVVRSDWTTRERELRDAEPVLTGSPYQVPPVPETWRRTEHAMPGLKLRGAGLGLFGLRSIPLVDRDESRDRIWGALRDVTRTRKARLELLRGGAGYGKSRLIEWIAERAHEVGAAMVLHATHSAHGGPADGLGPMIGSFLGCIGLDRRESHARTVSFLQDHPLTPRYEEDALSIVELMTPAPREANDETGPHALPRVHFSNPIERHGVFQRFFDRLCQRRACILWLDDVQWGAESLGFVQHIIELQAIAHTPLLILGTVRDDVLASRPVERGLIGEILDLERTSVDDLGPLPRPDHRELIGHLLGLDAGLVDEVADRTAGNPLFAIQLVGDWVQRGVLELGENGFELRRGERAEVPDDIHALWETRIGQLFPDPVEREHVWHALELAAALGKEFHPQEWQLVCRIVGVHIPRNMVDRLLAHRLLESTPTGLAFTHAMLCESLEKEARTARRLRGHHKACAQMLVEAYPANLGHIAERRGEHLMLAGELGSALEPLLTGALARLKSGELRLAFELFDRREEAMQALGISAGDERWGIGWVRQARAHYHLGDHDRVRELAERALERGREYGWKRVVPIANTERGNALLGQGHTREAQAAYEDALRLFGSVDAPSDHGDAWKHYASSLYFLHELDRCDHAIDRALELFDKIDDRAAAAAVYRIRGNVAAARGDARTAARYLEEALALFRKLGHRLDTASCLNDLGELWRDYGRFEEAEWYYNESRKLYEALGSSDAATPQLNLSLVLIARGRYDDAFEIVGRMRREFEEAGGESLDAVWIYATNLPCLAVRREFDDLHAATAELERRIRDTAIVDPDVAFTTTLGGRLTTAHKEYALARRILTIAADQHERLGEAAQAAAVREDIKRLPR